MTTAMIRNIASEQPGYRSYHSLETLLIKARSTRGRSLKVVCKPLMQRYLYIISALCMEMTHSYEPLMLTSSNLGAIGKTHGALVHYQLSILRPLCGSHKVNKSVISGKEGTYCHYLWYMIHLQTIFSDVRPLRKII